jgi:hypothetical protein
MNLFFGYLVGLLGDGGPARRKAITCTGQHNTEKREHTTIPRAGLEPTIPVFERLKTVHALDRAAIGTGGMSSEMMLMMMMMMMMMMMVVVTIIIITTPVPVALFWGIRRGAFLHILVTQKTKIN